jgi:hypothetical protein
MLRFSLILISSVNDSPPKNRVRTTSSSERSEQPLKVTREIIDNNLNNQLQGATTVSQHEGPSETTTQYTLHHQPPKNSINLYLESMPSVIQGTEVAKSERSSESTPGTQFKSSAVSISEHDLPHDLPPYGIVSIQEDTAPPEITGEPHGIANILSSAAPVRTSEQSSILKGKTSFPSAFPLAPALTLN